MSKNNKHTPRKGNLSGKDIDTSSLTEHSMSKSSDSQFTLVSYTRGKTRAGAATQVTTQTATGKKNETSSMNLVTTWQFKEFQKTVVSIIERILQTESSTDHPFIQRWLTVKKGSPNVTSTSTFLMVKKAFGLNDIQEYRLFLLTAPHIGRYMILGEPNPSGTGFYYQVREYTNLTDENEPETNNFTTPAPHQSTTMNETENHSGDVAESQKVLVSEANTKNNPGNPVSDNMNADEEQIATTTDSITTNGTIHKVCYGTFDDFQIMLKDMWPYIDQYMQINPDHDHTKQWNKWKNNGLTIDTDLGTFKQIIGIETLDQLYVILRDSPALNQHFDMVWDHKILYRPKVHVPILLSNTNNKMERRTYLIKTIADMDIEFCIFHSNIFREINQWSTQQTNRQDPKYIQWQKWLFSGLKGIQPTKEIRRIMGVTTILEYVQAVQPYPPFQEKFTLHDVEDNHVIRYSYVDHDLTHSDFVLDFNHFATYFDINLSQMGLRMQDFQTKIESCEYTLKNYFEQQKKKLTTYTSSTIEQYEMIFQTSLDNMILEKLSNMEKLINAKMDAIFQEKLQDFERHLTNMIDEMLQEVYSSADEGHEAMHNHIQQQLTEFVANLQAHRAAAKVNLNTHNSLSGHGHSFRTTEYSTGPPNATTIPTAVSPTPLKSRFSRGPPEPQYRRSPTAFDNTTHSLPDTRRFRAQNTSHQDVRQQPTPINIPTTVHATYNATGAPGLPPVNHDQALKRGKIQFTGLGEIFVFYNQLMNAMEQFGIYLVPLKQVKYQQSLCPDIHCGFIIDDYRRQLMASTLYQKLQNSEVIPLEFTSIRNIINRFAEANDGYQVLYAMLELVHPALQTDAVLSPPRSHECGDDIHLYAQKFDAWLRYENYANRPYSPREQVNKFISELSPHFAPAISRVRRLLDAWNPFDITVPEVLKIAALPNTIERFMNEEVGSNSMHIRKITVDRRNRTGQKTLKNSQKDTNTKDGKDEYCEYCGDFGHPTNACLFIAKLMNINEKLDKVDSKTRKELKDHHRKLQRERRERKLKRHTAKIRHLLDNGGTRDEVDALLDLLSTASDEDIGHQVDGDDDEDTTTSSE